MKRFSALIGVFLLGFVAAHAQETVKRGKYEAGPQMDLLVNRTLPNGEKAVFVQEQVAVLTLKDIEEQHSAPYAQGTHLICRQLYEYKAADGLPALAFDCGGDIYTASNIGFIARKDSKKYTGE